MRTTHPLHTSYIHKPINDLIPQLASYFTTQLILQMALAANWPSTAHTTAFHLHNSPYLPCQAVTKVHNIHNPLQHATQTQHWFCTPQVLKIANHAWHTQLQQRCSHPQHKQLSMHKNMHYKPSTAHSTAFHAQDNTSAHTSNKHKA